MKIEIFTFNPFNVNTYLIYDESKECVIIDAACYSNDEKEEIKKFISVNNLKPVKLLITHGHIDHIFGIKFLTEFYSISYSIGQEDEHFVSNARSHAAMFGFDVEEQPKPNSCFSDNQIIKFGNSELIAFHTPGHSQGSYGFYNKTNHLVFTGDVLFQNSIGRTDLPGGDYDTLINSIKSKLLSLFDETIVFPGHGPSSTIGIEKYKNPFLK